MALTYTNPKITINSVDLTDHIASVTINQKYDELDTTVFGVSGKQRIAGLEDSSIQIEFLQDYASASVEATLNSLIGTTTTVVIQAKTGTVSATNPKWTGTCLVTELQPVAGSAGELAKQSVTWPVSGTLTRATS